MEYMYIATRGDDIMYDITAQVSCKYLCYSCKELDLLCMWNGNIHLEFPDLQKQAKSVQLTSLYCYDFLTQRGEDYAYTQDDAEKSSLLS